MSVKATKISPTGGFGVSTSLQLDRCGLDLGVSGCKSVRAICSEAPDILRIAVIGIHVRRYAAHRLRLSSLGIRALHTLAVGFHNLC